MDDLVRKAKQGDKQAFTELINESSRTFFKRKITDSKSLEAALEQYF